MGDRHGATDLLRLGMHKKYGLPSLRNAKIILDG
jgi:hypothetical protein